MNFFVILKANYPDSTVSHSEFSVWLGFILVLTLVLQQVIIAHPLSAQAPKKLKNSENKILTLRKV